MIENMTYRNVGRAKYQVFAEAANALLRSGTLEAEEVVLDGELLKRVLARGLEFIIPGESYGRELFGALCRLTVTVEIVAVCLRRSRQNNAIEVLLTKRDDHPIYPWQWYCPALPKRPGESDEDVLGRSRLETELGTEIVAKQFVSGFDNPRHAAGHRFHGIYLCQVAPCPRGAWCPVGQLPEATVDYHRDHIIPSAVGAFRDGLGNPNPNDA